jgi:hypothetical protein
MDIANNINLHCETHLFLEYFIRRRNENGTASLCYLLTYCSHNGISYTNNSTPV